MFMLNGRKQIMKYALIIMDGAADEPLAQLEGRTVLEEANIPNTDWISMNGTKGIVYRGQLPVADADPDTNKWYKKLL